MHSFSVAERTKPGLPAPAQYALAQKSPPQLPTQPPSPPPPPLPPLPTPSRCGIVPSVIAATTQQLTAMQPRPNSEMNTIAQHMLNHSSRQPSSACVMVATSMLTPVSVMVSDCEGEVAAGRSAYRWRSGWDGGSASVELEAKERRAIQSSRSMLASSRSPGLHSVSASEKGDEEKEGEDEGESHDTSSQWESWLGPERGSLCTMIMVGWVYPDGEPPLARYFLDSVRAEDFSVEQNGGNGWWGSKAGR